MKNRNRLRKRYLIKFIMIVMVLLFFVTSNLFLNNGREVKGTNENTTLEQNQLSVTFIEGGYDPFKKKIFVTFSIPLRQIDALADYQLLAKDDKKSNPYLKQKTEKLTEDLFVCYLEPPKNKRWKKIGFEVFPKDNIQESEGNANQKFYLYQEDLKEKSSKKSRLIEKYHHFKIQDLDKKLKTNARKEKQLKQEIKKLEDANRELEGTLSGLIGEELIDVKNKIHENQSRVSQNQNEVKNLQKERKELEDKRYLLQEKEEN